MASKWKAGILAGALALSSMPNVYARPSSVGENGKFRHVLLLSIDGMYALDFENCVNGLPTINSGLPYCPNLAELGEHGVTYTRASASKPSDSFPGLMSIVTGGSPRTMGIFYDVAYAALWIRPCRTRATVYRLAPAWLERPRSAQERNTRKASASTKAS